MIKMSKKSQQTTIPFDNLTLDNNKSDHSLKFAFREIRDYFAGNVTGITRDEQIAKNLMRIIFCKLYIEANKLDKIKKFSSEEKDLKKDFENIFKEVKIQFGDIFEKDESIELNSKDLYFIVQRIENFSLLQSDRDVIGDAFEEIIGTAFRGGEGQFFTPRNIVEMMVEGLQPTSGENVMDPACGSGGFLAHTFLYLKKNNVENVKLYGLDKDYFLAKLARTYLTILENKRATVYCENSLDLPGRWSDITKENIKVGNIDVILTNPPFGAKIPVLGKEILGQYNLGHVWSGKDKKILTNQVLDRQAPQILFIERCLQLLRQGGRMGIVLPEGIFGNPSDRYVWEFLKENTTIKGVVSLAQEAFQPSTHTKTSVLFLEKSKPKNSKIFMAVAAKIGHNKNGKPIFKKNNIGKKNIIDDDTVDISINLRNFYNNKNNISNSSLGFTIKSESVKDSIYIPEYYNPEIENIMNEIKKNKKYELISLSDFVEKNIIQIKRGNEIGSEHYGSGEIPFVRTSDIVNWEIKVDPIKCVSEEVYENYKKSQDVKPNDILFVSDGTFLIGRSAYVTNQDCKIIIQSHVKKIRVLDNKIINPYYLFYLLNTNFVRRQIESKTFVQATISTIGNRMGEILLPLNKNKNDVLRIIEEVKNIIDAKAKLREKTLQLTIKSI
jgi:type I restriction enzyme M protein